MASICADSRVYFSEVLCYGIGHIGMCPSALHQAALLIAMVEEWKVVISPMVKLCDIVF